MITIGAYASLKVSQHCERYSHSIVARPSRYTPWLRLYSQAPWFAGSALAA